MNSANMTVTELTADDVAALSAAHGVTFHHRDGQSMMRARLNGHSDPAIFTARQQRLFPKPGSRDTQRMREIYCAHGFRCYEDHEPQFPDASRMDCLVSFVTPQVWRTVARSLRKGDTVTLVWVAGNDNEYLADAGLHMDELYLSVRNRIYLLTTSACRNNAARMIRRV